MRRAIESALSGGRDVEVLIIDNGSVDDTLAIARKYEAAYPEQVRAVYQENKGHGGAVNTAMELAEGVFFKVCNAEDCLDEETLKEVLSVLRYAISGSQTLDVLISDYVFEKENGRKKRCMHYVGNYPQNCIFNWEEVIRPIAMPRIVLMQSLTFRTSLLKECHLSLPEHNNYDDNLMVALPMNHAKKLYYLHRPFYHHTIEVCDKESDDAVIMANVHQQIKITQMIIDSYDSRHIKKQQQQFMILFTGTLMAVCTVMLLRLNTQESMQMRDDLWEYLKKKDLFYFMKIRRSFVGRAINIPGRRGRQLAVDCYQFAHKFYGFE